VDEFNEIRKRELLTSHVLKFDESMSAFIPSTGDLPYLSYVNRKPNPIGSEFKNIVDGLSGERVWLELQEGKNRMASKEYQQELGETTACVLRGVMTTGDSNSWFEYNETGKLFLCDSWFGSMKSVANVALLGYHPCMMVKTAHSQTR